jgi:general secretion pathway protein D
VPGPSLPRSATPLDKGGKDPTDSYITRLFFLKYVSVREAHAALINLANPQSIIPIDTAGMLIITDFDFNIKRFEEILTAMDVKKPDIAFEMVQLTNALASDVEQMLNNLVQTLIAKQAGRVPIAPGLTNQEQVKIVADKRTNSIVVLAEPNRMEQIKELVGRLDKQAPFETSGIWVKHLRHTNAVDMSRTLNALYKIGVDDKGIPQGGQSLKPNQQVGPQGGQPQPASGSTSASLTGAEPTIVADLRANSLIFITDRNTYRTLLEITEKLDTIRPQVHITATVVEIRAEEGVDVGMEINRVTDPEDHITTFIRSQFGASAVTPSGNTFNVVPVDTQGLTLALVKDRIGFIGGMLKLRKSKVSVDILDQPEATTSDNGVATMTVKQQVPVLQTTVTGTGVAQTSFSRFEEATTLLTISPHISEGGYLRLETKVKIEKFTGTSTDPTIPPPKTTREIETNSVRIGSSRTAVIGGIVTQDKSTTVSGIPFISDIPILGALFRRTQESDIKRTLYIFITPYILYDEGGGDLKKLTGDRKSLLEDLRQRGLGGLTPEGKRDPEPVSLFRYRRVFDWDIYVDEPRRR